MAAIEYLYFGAFGPCLTGFAPLHGKGDRPRSHGGVSPPLADDAKRKPGQRSVFPKHVDAQSPADALSQRAAPLERR